MSGKQFDIWGLPIEDDKGTPEVEATSSPDVTASDKAASDMAAPADTADTPDIAPAEHAAEEEELVATPAIAPASELSASRVDEPVSTDESVLTAAPTVTAAPTITAAPTMTAAPEETPVPEVVETLEAAVAEAQTPNPVVTPPQDEPAAVVASPDIASPVIEATVASTIPTEETTPDTAQTDAPAAVSAPTDALTTDILITDTLTTDTLTTDTLSPEDSLSAKPERAWIPPDRRKQLEEEKTESPPAANVAAVPVEMPASVGEAIPGASVARTDAPVQERSSPLAAPATAAGSGTYTGSYASYAPVRSGTSQSPVQPAVQPAVPPAVPPAASPVSPTSRYPAVAISPSPQSDDFWGVPPKAEAAQPAPAHKPAAQGAASVQPASPSANRSTTMSMPISNPLTAAAIAAAAAPPPAVGGLVPQAYQPAETRTTPYSSVSRTAARVQSEGRIEVVNPDGWKRDFPLRRSILYVGSAAGADILLPVAGIAPRHLQFVPSTSNRVGYRMINLGGAAVTVRSASSADPREVAPRASTELADGDRVEFGGYAIVFYSGEMSSQLIQVRLEVPNPRVELDKPLDGALYIRNGGDRAGVQFVVEVQGIDNRFVQIESGPVLFPDVEKRVAFRIAHPRSSQPAAGDHPINFVVTAPEGYPGETAVASQVVSIAPFFAHKVRLIAIEPELSGYSLSGG